MSRRATWLQMPRFPTPNRNVPAFPQTDFHLWRNENRHFALYLLGCGDFNARRIGEPPRHFWRRGSTETEDADHHRILRNAVVARRASPGPLPTSGEVTGPATPRWRCVPRDATALEWRGRPQGPTTWRGRRRRARPFSIRTLRPWAFTAFMLPAALLLLPKASEGTECFRRRSILVSRFFGVCPKLVLFVSNVESRANHGLSSPVPCHSGTHLHGFR